MKIHAEAPTHSRQRRAAADVDRNTVGPAGEAVNSRETAQRQRIAAAFGAPVQRVEDEELLQGKFTAQRMEDEDLLQGRFAPVQKMEEEELLQGRFGVAQARQEAPAARNDTGLPDALKAGVEQLSGLSMDGVRVHYNSSQPAQLNALAYAQGSDIHLAPGQEQHLPHEAWHVVQQAQGRVRATMQMKDGVPVNDDVGLEREADEMGVKALQAMSNAVPSGNTLSSLKAPGSGSQPVSFRLAQGIAQMQWVPKITDSARKHYGDGWGDSYGITNDTQLEDEVYEGEGSEGKQEIELGTRQNPVEHISKYCNILYENWTGKGGDDMSTIFHCGPGRS